MKLKCVKEYNENMGSVDKTDMLLSSVECVKPRPHYTTNFSEGTCDDMFGIVRCSAGRSANLRRTLSNVRSRSIRKR